MIRIQTIRSRDMGAPIQSLKKTQKPKRSKEPARDRVDILTTKETLGEIRQSAHEKDSRKRKSGQGFSLRTPKPLSEFIS
jgi:hypothetical protein